MTKCYKCDGTGRYKQPNDEELFNELVDKYDNEGSHSTYECIKMALNYTGYTIIPCPVCKGAGYI